MAVLSLTFSINVNSQTTAGNKKNVLFVMVDDLSDWVEGFGGNSQVKTPNLKKLVNRSVVFQKAYCSAPICGPSRASIFSGKYPLTLGQHENKPHFRDINQANADLKTIPQYFKQYGGYYTISSGKVFHKPGGNKMPFKVDSDPASFDEMRAGQMGTFRPLEVFQNQTDTDRFSLKYRFEQNGVNLEANNIGASFKQQFDWFPTVKDFRDKTQNLEDTEDYLSMDYIADYIENRANPNVPFFAAVGTLRPHTPFYCPKKYFDMYNGIDIKLPKIKPDGAPNSFDDLSDVSVSNTWTALHDEVIRDVFEKNADGTIKKDSSGKNIVKFGGRKKWKDFVKAYMANITFADACVGRVLDALDSKPRIKNNTIIVFMSDHGFSLGEKGYWTKPTFWEEISRIPMLIFDPSINASNNRINVNKVVSSIDLYPTLVELAGLPKNNADFNNLDGVSLKPLMENPSMQWNRIALTTRSPKSHTLRNNRFRYITRENNSEELYDHKNDPDEFFNLLSENAAGNWVLNIPTTNASYNAANNALQSLEQASKDILVNKNRRKRVLINETARQTLSIADEFLENSAKIYHAIEDDNLTFYNLDSNTNHVITIYDITGKVITKSILVNNSISVKTLNNSTVYLAKIDSNNKSKTIKFAK